MIDPDSATAIYISNEEVVLVDLENGGVKSRVENDQEASFSISYALSSDKSLFAVSHFMWERSSGGSVTVIDLESGEKRVCATAWPYISRVAFTQDNQLVVVSHERVDMSDVSLGDLGTAYVEKFDLSAGRTVWTQTVPYQLLGIDSAMFQLKCREYQDNTGKSYDQVLLSVDQSAYTWDSATGELIAQVNVNNGIQSFMVAKNSSYGYLGESSGIIDIVDMTTGINYTSSAIDTGKNLTDMAIQNSTVVVEAYASPDLTMMKYHQGAGAEELHTYEGRVRDVLYSPEETYYVVRINISLDEDICYFYRIMGNEPVGEWRGDIGYQNGMGFIDDSHFVLLDTDGQFVRYDVETGQTDILSVESTIAPNIKWDSNRTTALCYASGVLYALDLQSWEIAETIDVRGDASYVNIFDAELSADGSKLYANLQDQGLIEIETATGRITPVPLGEHLLSRRISDLSAITLSEDGVLLAVYCTDGTMRIYETEGYELRAEIPFAGVHRRFLHFLEDGSRLILQGDDYYLRVYDMEEQKFVYIAPEQYYQIKSMTVDEDADTISLVTSVDMMILNGSTYECIAHMEDGLAYLPRASAVFAANYASLYRFPYKTLDMLLKEAAEQFGDVRLTELERTRYNVD
ncbi:MAG: WD40 repeat domain-containing protein [Acetatifactor sp.]|nr:WD40 repeat domain-containing protein [Acetatifactor sp.]